MTELQRFRLALTVSGVSAAEFARKLNVTPRAIYGVIAKSSKSKRLETAIKELIRENPVPRSMRRAA